MGVVRLWRSESHLKGIGRAAVVVAALGLQATAVLADPWDDCVGAAPDKIAAGCSAVIEANQRGAADIAKAHIRRGYQQRDQGHLAEALADFESAVQLDPLSAEAFVALG